ncbi:hypothetical protein Aduo_010239 [Ancylostoma duodenale]
MDLPCYMKPITFNARTGFDFSTKERNVCYIDEYEKHVKCVCDTDQCSTNCTQIVAMWRKSKDYEAEGAYGNCMNEYMNDCFAGKIKQPIKGETMDAELQRLSRGQS